MKIILVKRSDDWMAHLDINKAIWGCGKTPSEAIGDLIRTHAAKFSIEIHWPS